MNERRTLEVVRIYPSHRMAVEGYVEYEDRFKTHPDFIFKRSNLTIEGQGIITRFMIGDNLESLRGLRLDKVVLHEQIKLTETELQMLKAELVMSKVGSPILKM